MGCTGEEMRLGAWDLPRQPWDFRRKPGNGRQIPGCAGDAGSRRRADGWRGGPTRERWRCAREPRCAARAPSRPAASECARPRAGPVAPGIGGAKPGSRRAAPGSSVEQPGLSVRSPGATTPRAARWSCLQCPAASRVRRAAAELRRVTWCSRHACRHRPGRPGS